MTLLDEIIDASSDSKVPTPDLLRKVLTVAHRLGAADIVQWTKHELSGYPKGIDVPAYRTFDSNVMALFTGPMQSQIRHQLTARPEGMDDLWRVDMREPLVELQALAEAEAEPSRAWSAYAVKAYEESGVFRIQYHNLFSAWNVVTRQSLLGVVDSVRSKALEFALELQADFPNAGAVGGPTVENPGVARVVYNLTNNITGDGTNVAAGAHIRQKSVVNKGDEASLRREVGELGLSAHDIDDFILALRRDGRVDGPVTTGFLDRVRTGAIAIAGSVSSDVIAGALIELGKGFLGLS
ncbi:hypothetical protein [Agromyces sp. GXQ0307]|uniref:AbiTii domain-containing protein n=1 Tax=Agromyces sp. GXQ0307 TaxID=3377835 RepID=UPI00383A1465